MRKIALTVLVFVLFGPAWAFASNYASSVFSYSNLGSSPYDDPNSALGPPTTWILDPGTDGDVAGTYACSMVYGAWNTDPSGNKLVVTIQQDGYLELMFDQPLYADPENWYGKDFIVFGNSFFPAGSYVEPGTDMSACSIPNGNEGDWQQMSVSVAQYADGPWYTYSSGPYADDFAPTQAFAWDWVNKTWGPQLDPTRPLDPSLTPGSFSGLSVAGAIDLYEGSAGGTAFSLNDLPDLPALSSPGDPNNGRKWIQYIRITANLLDQFGLPNEGQVDAVARVSHQIYPISIGQAKELPDGTEVILDPASVTAGTNEIGPYCYVEQTDRSAGIKVLGRVFSRSNTVTLYGDMGTVNGERVLLATAAQTGSNNTTIAPLGMSANCVASATGLNNAGLLVSTWGKVAAVSPSSTPQTLSINDGSGTLTCIASASVDLSQLAQGEYVRVTGISARQSASPALLVRDQSDLEVIATN